IKPDWMKKKQEEQEAAARELEVRRQPSADAVSVIEKDGPRFWKELKEKLVIAVSFLPNLNLTGSITTVGDVSSADAIRVTINKPGTSLNQTYTDLYFNIDAKQIRCGTLNGGVYTLLLGVTPDRRVEVIRPSKQSKAMAADATSQYVME